MPKSQLPQVSESVTQQHIMEWTDFIIGRYPEIELLFHIPNGGLRNKGVAGKLKAEGAKAGVPDLCLPVGRGGFFGLYIELKVGKNKTDNNQKWWLSKLEEQGYYTALCYGFDETTGLIEQYLKLPTTKDMIPTKTTDQCRAFLQKEAVYGGR